jgi:hypothetical protein
MKKIILFLLITLVFTFAVSAQNKWITKEEYNDALIKAAQKQQNVPHIIKGVIDFYDAKRVIYEKRSSLKEYLSSEHFRTVSTTETNGTITTDYQFVKIGNVEYTKKGDEPWIKEELAKNSISGGRSSFLTGTTIQSQRVEEYLLIPMTIDGKAVNVYFHYEVSKPEKDNHLTFIESRNTISADGYTLKWTYKVSKIIPENVSHISTTTYEYNPKDLKIEAPIK